MSGRARLAVGGALIVLLLGGAAVQQLGGRGEARPDDATIESLAADGPGVDLPATAATGTPEVFVPPDPADRAGPDSTGTRTPDDLAPHDAGTFREDGMVLQDVVIAGDVLLSGSNQVLRNVRVEGAVRVTGDGTTIEDSALGSLVLSGTDGFTGSRLEIFGHPGDDGIHISSDTGQVQDVLIEHTWVHSPSLTEESHYDGIQVRGVQGLTLREVFLDLGPFDERYATAVFLQEANGGNAGVLIESSWIDGGAFALHLNGTDITVVDTVFGPNFEYGLRYPNETVPHADGNVLENGAPADL